MEEKKEFIFPNWKNSNLNISATLAEFLGVPNQIDTLPILKEKLNKNYKNVIFFCFDGLGNNPIEKNLDKNNFLRKNIIQTLTSTFPSTTTNATASLMFNQYPLQHGWFGWSVNFKNLNKNVNIFLDTDSWTDEKLTIEDSPLGALDYYFDHAASEYQINTVFPRYVKVNHSDRNYQYDTMEEFFESIKNICNKNAKQFVYAYYPDPDFTMHDYGVSSPEAKKVINNISNLLQNLYQDTENTLMVITADHGQIDVEGYIELYKDQKLMEMLEIYPYLDSRAPAFIVKNRKNKEFEEYFSSKYGKDFTLYSSKKLIEDGIFGPYGDKASLLGDYIAVGTYTHKQALLTPKSHKFKGHHTSLTEEMLIPLIVLEN